MDPLELRYSQDSCNNKFKDGPGPWAGAELAALWLALLLGIEEHHRIKPIRVVFCDGYWWSLDNRRLAVLQLFALCRGRLLRIRVRALEAPPRDARRVLLRSGHWDSLCMGRYIFVRHESARVGPSFCTVVHFFDPESVVPFFF